MYRKIIFAVLVLSASFLCAQSVDVPPTPKHLESDDSDVLADNQATIAPQASVVGGSYDFNTIDAPGATATVANGLNDRGDIVGRYNAGGVMHGFLLNKGTFTTIDAPGSIQTGAIAINNRGTSGGALLDSNNVRH